MCGLTSIIVLSFSHQFYFTLKNSTYQYAQNHVHNQRHCVGQGSNEARTIESPLAIGRQYKVLTTLVTNPI